MEVRPLGTQYCVQGSRLGVERTTTSFEGVLSTGDSLSAGIHPGPSVQSGSQESKISEIPRSTFLCPQEGLEQEESNSRLVGPQQVHQVRQISHVDCQSGQDAPPSEGVHGLDRPDRRLLARPSVKETVPLSGLQTGETVLRLQGDALRAECRTPDIYKTWGHHSQTTPRRRDSHSSLSGRLAGMGSHRRKMSPLSRKDFDCPKIPGVSDQPQEVQADSGTQVRVAGVSMGHVLPHTLTAGAETEVHCITGAPVPKGQEDVQKGSRESSRLPTVRFYYGPSSQGQIKRYQSGLAQQGQCQTQRSEETHTSVSKGQASSLDDSQKSLKDSSDPRSSPLLRDPHRRFPQRLGRPRPQGHLSGTLVPDLQDIPYKYPGGHGSVPLLETPKAAKEDSYPSGVGQSSDCPLHQQKGLEIETHKSRNSSHPSPSEKKGLASISHSFGGSEECGSGLPVETEALRIGVVSGHEFLPLDPGPSPRSPDRSFRHEAEQQASELLSPQPGPSGLCHGRNVGGLEPLGESLPISSGELSPEGSPQTPGFQRASSSSGSSLAEEQLVSSPSGASSSSSQDSEPDLDSGCPNQDCTRFILADEQPDFMAFIKFAAKKRFGIDPENMEFTEADKTSSTVKQYDSAFKKLVNFIKLKKFSYMTVNHALSFFRHLHESGFASGTVTTIKSALAKVFLYGFDINVNDRLFASIPRSCAKLRPSPRPQTFSWSINKVLGFASALDNGSCTFQQLLRKTLFLVSLASGSRVSELAALSRDPDHVRFLPSGSARLSPHVGFFAKNEDPTNRWQPWEIVPLPQDDSLCPVHALKTFLNRTQEWDSGPLFRREKGGTISVNGIRQQILYFIKDADPSAIPKTHDVRKLATSLNFLNFMDFSALKRFTGWRSSKVFIRHYLKNVESLDFHAVAAGKVIQPSLRQTTV